MVAGVPDHLRRRDREHRRGIERGELRADVDLEMVLDLLAAPIYYRRIVSGGTITPGLTEKIVDHEVSAFTSCLLKAA